MITIRTAPACTCGSAQHQNTVPYPSACVSSTVDGAGDVGYVTQVLHHSGTAGPTSVPSDVADHLDFGKSPAARLTAVPIDSCRLTNASPNVLIDQVRRVASEWHIRHSRCDPVGSMVMSTHHHPFFLYPARSFVVHCCVRGSSSWASPGAVSRRCR